MKLELKNIKHAEFASQETYCYEAKLYVDGKPFATVSNEGHGGPDMVGMDPRWYKKWEGEDHLWTARKGFNDRLKEIEAHIKDTVPAEEVDLGNGKTFMSQPNLESWCCDRVNDFLTEKAAKRLLKRNLMTIENGKCWTYRDYPSAAAIQNLKDKRGREVIVLNGLPLPEAIDMMREAGAL